MKRLPIFLVLLLPLIAAAQSHAQSVSSPPLKVQTIDGTVAGFPYQLNITNGQLSYSGGIATITISSGGASAPFADNAALVKNNADNTKLAIFSAINITTGTTRTYTLIDGNGTIPIGPTAGPITFAGPSAARTITFPDASITVARTDAGNTFTGHQTIEGVTSTGATGTGNLVFSAAPLFSTSITTPLVIGGSAVGANLSLQSTSGAGTTDFVNVLVGNAGATESARFFHSGGFSVGTTTDPGAGIINALTGFRINNAAASGHVPRGNGTNYVDGQLACGDLSNSGNGCSGTLPVGANPTASLGLSAVNGASASFMRADAAPALSQSINPTWTSQHIWSVSNAAAVSIGPNGDTNPVLRVVTNIASQAAGVSVTGNAAGSGTTFTALSSASDEGMTFVAKGLGSITFKSGSGSSTTSFQIQDNTGTGVLTYNNNLARITLATDFRLGASNLLQFSSDSGINRGAVKVIRVGDGGANANGWLQWSGEARMTADATNATATFSNLSDLTISNLQAGRKYTGRMTIKCVNSTATEGIQFDFNGGTATMTNFFAGAGILASGGTDVIGTNISTSLAGVINFTTFTGESVVVFDISFVVNSVAGGTTIIPRFAENTSTVGTATVRLGSFIILNDSPN